MTPRDVEMDLARFLESAGLNLSTTSDPPTLYAGQYAESSPDQLVLVRHVGGEGSQYLGSRRGYLVPDVQVVVRGHRERITATRELAVQCWAVLHMARIPGLVSVTCDGAGPIAQPPDVNGRPRFSFNVTASYVA